eukprot:4487105-Alexandrium_andersonii.AAC.1
MAPRRLRSALCRPGVYPRLRLHPHLPVLRCAVGPALSFRARAALGLGSAFGERRGGPISEEA